MHEITGLFLIGVIIVSVSSPVAAETFQEKPITEGLYLPTAYTLKRSEMLIRLGGFAFRVYGKPGWVYYLPGITYGVTNDLQLGTAIPGVFFEPTAYAAHIFGKYHFIQLFGSKIEIAARSGLNIHLNPIFTIASVTVVSSWEMSSRLGLHTGIGASIHTLAGFRPLCLTTLIDWDVLPNIKVLSEVLIGPWCPALHIGMTTRLLTFLNLKVRARFSLAPSPASFIGSELSVRF